MNPYSEKQAQAHRWDTAGRAQTHKHGSISVWLWKEFFYSFHFTGLWKKPLSWFHWTFSTANHSFMIKQFSNLVGTAGSILERFSLQLIRSFRCFSRADLSSDDGSGPGQRPWQGFRWTLLYTKQCSEVCAYAAKKWGNLLFAATVGVGVCVGVLGPWHVDVQKGQTAERNKKQHWLHLSTC